MPLTMQPLLESWPEITPVLEIVTLAPLRGSVPPTKAVPLV